ncbi:hypothetical protein [Sinorhizobium meliloti]|uniref:hypothetical protein n=1 Tax=Rhizobium meliloti TaxID=382 RepID=UPI00299E9339|nr:hypothetical protein [Sinorhizobium meliloti]MDW9643485.1 hypothetical protein [Sinorhizobium meliloti]MDX0028554.1 hypothetical protein [Sinorhizobium meliloti]MDX0073510.1 hypothetical protein [Sinorhizobium meliloti]
MKITAALWGAIFLSSIGTVSAQDNYDLTPNYSAPSSDLQRALESPAPEPYVPNALEMMEQGNIPSSANTLPDSGGFGMSGERCCTDAPTDTYIPGPSYESDF